MIDTKQIKGNSPFAIQARKRQTNEFALMVVEQYADAGIVGKDHLLLIFGKENLIKMHEYYLTTKYLQK